MPASSGSWLSNSVNASRPPAEAPIPAIGKPSSVGAPSDGLATAAAETRFNTDGLGVCPFTAFFTAFFGAFFKTPSSRGGYPLDCGLVGRSPWTARDALVPQSEAEAGASARARVPAPRTVANCTGLSQAYIPLSRNQVLDDFADLHKLIQARRLGNESGNSEIREQSLVSPGLRRTPHAHWNAGEVFGASDLTQQVFAGVLRQIQVQQDQVWNFRIGIGALPANESQGLAPVQQMNQFKSEVLLFQCPFEKEDVPAVVFNDHKPGSGNNRSLFQSPSFRVLTCLQQRKARQSRNWQHGQCQIPGSRIGVRYWCEIRHLRCKVCGHVTQNAIIVQLFLRAIEFGIM